MAEDYTDGFRNAYNYAYEKWVTTMNSISKANMYWSITRIEMAKMISEFSINVLWLKPDETKKCTFYDTDPDLDKQYNYWVTKACQLWLMWIYDDWTKADYFNPKKTVTRWEWATILSRAIRLSEWKKVIKNWNPFYEPHLNFLLIKWIINSYDNPSPKSEEKRWNVMSMIYKTDSKNTIVVKNATWFVSLEAWQIYRNDYFDIQITSDWKSPRLVAINEAYDEYTKSDFYMVEIYNYVEEKKWTLTFTYGWKFKENAKQYNVEWSLMPISLLFISEKWWFCDQQWDNDWSLSDFWLFVYKTNKYIIRDAGFSLYQELPFYDTSYDDIRNQLWNSYINEVEVAIWELTRDKASSYLDNFYIKWEPIGLIYTPDKKEIQKYENVIEEARKEIKRVNNKLSNVPKEKNSNWNTIISQKTKMYSNDVYYNSKYEFKMKREWSFPWLIADNNSVSYDKWGISIYVFIPETIWNYYLEDEFKKNLSKNAKQLGQSWYLMEVKEYYFDTNDCVWEDTKKWKTKKWFNICLKSSSDYLIFGSRFPYESNASNEIEEEKTKEYFVNEVWYFPIETDF